eukprot:TRINITY_DN11102_c0_g1_i14.p3 TRINITY_DN11102_c0_g1~~TRINITY_DN11102_c0_g1_i14.p3  ORF type:complete len:178 (+),score=26.55 TRINITY_DN11102_c0_g1_i14:451-984(+)
MISGFKLITIALGTATALLTAPFDGTIPCTVTTNLHIGSGETWRLKCPARVQSGATLQIDAGATIKADLKRFGRLPSIIIEQGTSPVPMFHGSLEATLTVCHLHLGCYSGATIIANGTETAPITMTTTATQHQLNRMSDTRGLWGGLAIFGSAPIGTRSSSGTELFNFQGGMDDRNV